MTAFRHRGGLFPERSGQPPPSADRLVHTPVVRGVLMRACAVLVGIVLASTVAELGLRACGVRPERYAPPRWVVRAGENWRRSTIWGDGLIKQPSRYREQGVLMGEYVPGAHFKVIYASDPRRYFDADGGVEMLVNSHGFRGPEVSTRKPARTFRIFGLGDSFTFGRGVREQDTFLRLLETRLNRGAPPERYEVLNLGVDGYNTRDEALYLEGRWLAYGPDLVLVNFYLNDAYDDAAFLNNGEALGIYDPPSRLARISRLYDHWEHWRNRREVARRVRQYYLSRYFQDADEYLEAAGRDQVDWTVSKRALARIAEFSRQHSFRLALILWPELDTLDGRYPFEDIHRVVMKACESLSIPALDLREAFRGSRPEDLWVHPTDHHPNERAHAAAAEAIELFLKSHGLIAK